MLTPKRLRRSGSMETSTSGWLAPKTSTLATSGSRSSSSLIGLSANSRILRRSTGYPGAGVRERVMVGWVAWLILKICGGRIPWGRRAVTLLRALATSVAAASSPFSYSNSAVTTDTSSLEVEVTRRTMSMVESSFSIVRVMSDSTSLDAAPGMTVIALIWGRSVSGKRLKGIRRYPMIPTIARRRTTERTRCGFLMYLSTKLMIFLPPGCRVSPLPPA